MAQVEVKMLMDVEVVLGKIGNDVLLKELDSRGLLAQSFTEGAEPVLPEWLERLTRLVLDGKLNLIEEREIEAAAARALGVLA